MGMVVSQGDQPPCLSFQILWQSTGRSWGTHTSRAEIRQREQKSVLALRSQIPQL